ncbi:ATP-binding protein [Diaphorobacter limosus]|uniref:histidine kinase n=1 Tax=Diaphorobacter limosus TaxID=3036128 RepID=A0ABZ0J751_9BURK|nr:ATP-binding protein [Diaphorobacter sp. Y-1]WOO33683.1 ATP-binding protein [Diaphorobacter sp. Y-1]
MPKPSRMHILIVEDNTLVASGIRAGLELHGFASDTAASVAQAEAHLAARSYDACVLDLGLPDGDGMQLLQLARVESASSAETPETQGAAIALPPALLTCAVTNLLDNALRHHRGSTAITIALRLCEGASVDISVRDHGPGLTEQECTQALQRFWRKGGSGPGSGLGLTIARRIAESAGGSLHLAPAQPGLLARLQLPTLAPATEVGHG